MVNRIVSHSMQNIEIWHECGTTAEDHVGFHFCQQVQSLRLHQAKAHWTWTTENSKKSRQSFSIFQPSTFGYCRFYFSLNQFGHSHLTSLINKTFSPTVMWFAGLKFLTCICMILWFYALHCCDVIGRSFLTTALLLAGYFWLMNSQ